LEILKTPMNQRMKKFAGTVHKNNAQTKYAACIQLT